MTTGYKLYFKDKAHQFRFIEYLGIVTGGNYFRDENYWSSMYILAAINKDPGRIAKYLDVQKINFEDLIKEAKKNWWCEGELSLVLIAANCFNSAYKADIHESFCCLDNENRITALFGLELIYLKSIYAVDLDSIIKTLPENYKDCLPVYFWEKE